MAAADVSELVRQPNSGRTVDDIPIGTKFRARHLRLYHVRGTIDDQCIVRWWSRRWQCWRYEALDETFFSVYGWPTT